MKNILQSIKKSKLTKKYLQPYLISLIEKEFSYDKTVYGHFTDSNDIKYELYRDLRSRIKPGWESMLNSGAEFKIPSEHDIKFKIKTTKNQLRELRTFLKSFNFSFNNKNILELGCYDGIKTILLAATDCHSVTGSDVTFYYNNQRISENENLASRFLNRYRAKILSVATYCNDLTPILSSKIKFIEDDISNSKLPNSSFDLVVSWETLEHIISMGSALHHINRILTPGGIAFHEYNPFFAMNGGHSLCTLDFLWGHCRLSESDFVRYIKELRENEFEPATTFYKKNLNRLTIEELRTVSKKAGLEILALIPFVKKSHLLVFNYDILVETKRNYPSVEMLDCISPVVWVIHQKI